MTSIILMTKEELETIGKAGHLLLEFAEIDDTNLWVHAHDIGDKILKFLQSYTESVNSTTPMVQTVAEYSVPKW